ncbi:pirin family protein [Sinorhizobium meliloti]|uniref:pirin family protein n=1 Tax=Rhizobium meliloti TaxID=382 RepID=UPI001322FC6A|nr:pirin family protein [Sinorhizobium meliloti]
MRLKGDRTSIVRDMGGFVVRVNMPGWLKPRPTDHGHGPLAMIVESSLDPGRPIAMHEHRNDEIISWVPFGVMRHDDKTTGRLVTDSKHLLVMNAGRSFWHSEETLSSDPPLRMLQIFVRPRAVDLDPRIQHGPIPLRRPNTWRHLVGPEGGDAPFHIRNTIDLFDIRLEPGARLVFPHMRGRDLYFYVYSGLLFAAGQTFAEGAQGLLLSDRELSLESKTQSTVVAFLIDPHAPITRKGTVGDHRKIPPVILIRMLRKWRQLWKWRRSY